jgi:hypothetical protein
MIRWVYAQLSKKLSILQVDGGYVIGFRSDTLDKVAHNAIHNEDYTWVIYPTKKAAIEAASKINELRAIKYMQYVKVL